MIVPKSGCIDYVLFRLKPIKPQNTCFEEEKSFELGQSKSGQSVHT